MEEFSVESPPPVTRSGFKLAPVQKSTTNSRSSNMKGLVVNEIKELTKEYVTSFEEHIVNDVSIGSEPFSADKEPTIKIFCYDCQKLVPVKDAHMKCACCNQSFHLSCSKFNADVYAVLNKENCFDQIDWCCSLCRARGAKLSLPENKAMMDLITSLQSRVLKLEDNVSTPTPLPPLKLAHPDGNSHNVLMIPDSNKNMKTFSEIAEAKLPNISFRRPGLASKGQGFIKLPDKSVGDAAMDHHLKKDYNDSLNKMKQREFTPNITKYHISTEYSSNNTMEEFKKAFTKSKSTHEICHGNNTY